MNVDMGILDNTGRLYSSLGYVTPRDRMEGRHEAIQVARGRKLDEAREARRPMREMQRWAA
jgi:hypothetical protein